MIAGGSCVRRCRGVHMASSEHAIVSATSFEGSSLFIPRQSIKSKVEALAFLFVLHVEYGQVDVQLTLIK